MTLKAGHALFTLYDEMNEAYKTASRDAFRREITRHCAEFNRIFPGNSEALVAMQMHFASREEVKHDKNAS